MFIKNFDTFLEKEINETSEVLNKTLENYLTKNKLNFKDIKIKNVVKKITDQLMKSSLLEWHFYTASVVISSILRDNLTQFNKKLISDLT